MHLRLCAALGFGLNRPLLAAARIHRLSFELLAVLVQLSLEELCLGFVSEGLSQKWLDVEPLKCEKLSTEPAH